MLSIVGAAGTGKTRLALHLATEQARAGGWSGVHFVPLETLRDADQVAAAIGSVLGLDLPEGGDPEATLHQLRTAIGDRPRLIVLDNFEHLLPAGPLLSELVRACPRLHLVVTSRARLNLAEERAVVLEGLPFPGSGASEPADERIQAALAYDAVRLFVQRARRARADFAPDEHDLDAVVRICAAVGGVPLALEMASAWLRVMSCADIADELEQGSDLLESQNRDRPERQQEHARRVRAVLAAAFTG
ncbi:MAG: AAA family ATPase [Trueperaceae bacterium]|nr:AAA family ATPase [Trueperaceae bacterium]